MAPPGLSRYLGGPQSMSQFGHPQQQHLQHHAHNLGSSNLARPSLGGGHPSFGNPNSSLNLFAPSGAGSGGFGGGFGGGAGAGGSSAAGGNGTGLGSHAAQMGFAHGMALQRQEAHDVAGMGGSDFKSMGKGRIRDVWRGNLAQEMAILRGLVERYPYISMDTEFPGIVARPMGTFTTKADYHYQTLRCNVDLLKMIQLGITLLSPEGELPPPHTSEGGGGSTYQNNLMPCPCTWQFNFRFSVHEDMYAQDSIDLLQKSGLDFQMHEKNGIDPLEFGSYLITSGLVLTEDVRWISFHSGYDFGYLLKIMMCQPLPDDEVEFRKQLDIFFPSLYDIKFLMKSASRKHGVNDSPLSPHAAQILNNLGQKSGLQDIADELGVKRVGPTHQAGSDSLVTGKIFFEMRRLVFGGDIDDGQYMGQVWGLNGVGQPASATAAAASAGAASHGQPAGANGASTYANGGAPSTPNTGHVSLANTPAHGQSAGNGLGPMTPGGGGGAFGAFQFGK
ncbi:MAG: hypothetical protein M1832_001568 [Thelocarpon impressellum]|nr:MAG: hypothetical protein M1832_001568 [Thelocarpon impressellum]